MESERRSVLYSLSEQTTDENIYKNPGVVERQRQPPKDFIQQMTGEGKRFY